MRSVRLLSVMVGLSMLFGSTALIGAAQEATPGGPSEGYPVALHEGSCTEPVAEAAWQLDNAVSIGVDQDEPEVVGPALTRTVTSTSSAVDFNLDSVADSSYVIAVHASPDEFGTIVACGQIAGIKVDGKLVVALVPMGDSQVNGIAILDEDNGGVLGLGEDQTQITVYITVPDDDGEATPVA